MGLSDLLVAFLMGFGFCAFTLLIALMVLLEVDGIRPAEPTKEEWRHM